MLSPRKKFIVSHAPFWHAGTSITERSYHMMLAALPAILMGFVQYGISAVGVVALSISTAIFWEYAFNKVSKRTITVGDGNAAVTGLIFAMMLPATAPWWLVVVGTFVAMIIGKHIFGGIGANPFNPALLAISILMVSWEQLMDLNGMLLNYDFNFTAIEPQTASKYFGASAVTNFTPMSLLIGQQIGGLGTTFGLGLIAGGIYLILRGFIRWELSVSFIIGLFITALAFNISDSTKYAGPAFHLLSGYSLIGAFFLVTEDSSSPVNFIPMLIYGSCAGILVVLIRNIGFWVDGVVFAILFMNIVNPLLDKIRPKALGKVGN